MCPYPPAKNNPGQSLHWKVLSAYFGLGQPVEENIVGKQSSSDQQVDVTYVKRGQVAAITRMRPAQPSDRAQQAIARAAGRRSGAR